MTTTETHQLTIARAIAYVLKTPWAVWANKRHPDPDCVEGDPESREDPYMAAADELAALRARVAELEAMLREATAARPIWDQIDALAERVADGAAASAARIRADERARTEADIAALRRERDELRATLTKLRAKAEEHRLAAMALSRDGHDIWAAEESQRAVGLREACEVFEKALNPTGDDHG
jgi:hypothetical protein